MTTTQTRPWYQLNESTPDLACEYCRATAHHEFWCITENLEVLKAWQAVLNPAKLSLHDRLILHALGVAWLDTSRVARQTATRRTRPALPVIATGD
ncbi:MAG: hypothetical protein WBS19_03955 [Candidatus Korobacteraceae bacterium]